MPLKYYLLQILLHTIWRSGGSYMFRNRNNNGNGKLHLPLSLSLFLFLSLFLASKNNCGLILIF